MIVRIAVLTHTTGTPSENGSTRFKEGPEQTNTHVSVGNLKLSLIHTP